MLLGYDDPLIVLSNLDSAASSRPKVMQSTRRVYQVVALFSIEQVLSASKVQLSETESQVSNISQHGVGRRLMIGLLIASLQLKVFS